MSTPAKKSALVLSGGGANGAFQAGAIASLTHDGMEFFKVRGISVGALNGLMVALDKIPEMQQIWWMITPDQVIRKRGMVRVGGSYLLHRVGIHRPPMGYHSNTPLKEIMATHAVGTTIIDYMAGVVDVQTGIYQEHWIPRGQVISPEKDHPWVLASTAIPAVFDPVDIEGRLWVDGGVRRQNPITPILKNEPDEVIIINCGARNQDFDRPVKNIIDVSMNSLQAMMDEVFNVHQEEFHRINRMVAQSEQPLHNRKGESFRYYPNMTIEPAEDLGDSLDFSRSKARRLFDMGWHEAKRQFEKYRKG